MLDPATAWYRKAQIDYSMDDILGNPFFGTETWTRPIWVSASIDDHFLAIALRSGIPSLVFFLAALYLLWRALAQIDANQQPMQFARLRRGWGLMMVALIFGGLTVTYFGRMQPLLAFYVGLGACVAASVTAPARSVSSSKRQIASNASQSFPQGDFSRSRDGKAGGSFRPRQEMPTVTSRNVTLRR